MTLYKVSRPTSRRVIPPDCVSKDVLRKLIDELKMIRLGDSFNAIDCERQAERLEVLHRFEQLL